MSERKTFGLYQGDGTTLSARDTKLSLYQPIGDLDDPAGYLAEKGLCDAVNVALTLGQPLLLTGEPGTGKTQLAASVAYGLDLPSPLVFHVKTTSSAKDLFYRYDSLRHFHDSQFQSEGLSVEDYITYEPFGLAILLSQEPAAANPYLPVQFRDKGPTRSVVLIDEIDKAPRDLPNDVLNEIENMSFTVKETGKTFTSDTSYRPILILTRNSEKHLPDAFLRRCVFYHIAFPTTDRLTQIVQLRLQPNSNFTPEMLGHAIQHFEEIRELGLRKPPATAELLGWVKILENLELDVSNLKPGQVEALAFSYCVLAKTKEDLDRLRLILN